MNRTQWEFEINDALLSLKTKKLNNGKSTVSRKWRYSQYREFFSNMFNLGKELGYNKDNILFRSCLAGTIVPNWERFDEVVKGKGDKDDIKT